MRNEIYKEGISIPREGRNSLDKISMPQRMPSARPSTLQQRASHSVFSENVYNSLENPW